jgi:GDP-L-fucose synthase
MNGMLLQNNSESLSSHQNQFNKDYVSLMPTIFMELDNFDLTSSHVLPAMMRKFHEARNGNAQ